MSKCDVVAKVDGGEVCVAVKDSQVKKRFFNVREISIYLGMSVPTIYRYAEEKKVPYFKIGKVLRFDVQEIERWMRAFKKEPIL